jgi:WD40 repeat protein
MTLEKRFSPSLDLVAGLVTGSLLSAIAVVIIVGRQIGIRVTAQLPEDGLLGPFGAVTLVFSEPVEESLVMDKFSIQPPIGGGFKWSDSKTLQFIPTQPYAPGVEYTLSLAPGPLSGGDTYLKKAKSWTFQVRAPRIVYLVKEGDTSRLWVYDVDTEASTPLTDDSLKIFNYDASQNGEFVVISAFNERGGADLWRVGRSGGSPALALQCGPDRCSVPAISPDGRLVAYVREAAGPGADLQFGSPRIWVFNLETREDAPLYEDQQIIGYGPEWSPDGTRLSSFDGIKDEIRIIDFYTNQQVVIPSQLGSPVAWSGDGSNFAFTDLASNELGEHTRVRLARLSLDEIITLFGEQDERDYYYNSLAWSPVENKLVIGLRPNATDPSAALWIMDPITRDGWVIADQPDYIYNNPSWDPWGWALVFQQFRLKGVYEPEIALWLPGYEQPQALGEGLLPQWLP